MLNTFLFYGSIILLLLFGYILHGVWLVKRINKASQKYFWPRRWLLLAIFPFVGWYLYRRVKNASIEKLSLLIPDIEITHELSNYHNSGWILFQEQYDRKSGDHQGTSFHALNQDEYYIVSYTHHLDDQSPLLEGNSEIVIPYPGKVINIMRERFQWAKLLKKDNGWYIQNERVHTVIPVFETSNDDILEDSSVRLCKPQDLAPTQLNNGAYFVAHTTEFRVFCLPELAIYKIITKNQKHFVASIHAEVCINEKGEVVTVSDAFIIINGNVVSVESPIVYISVFMPQTSLSQGKFVLPLNPGDIFEIPGTSINLLIDYDLGIN